MNYSTPDISIIVPVLNEAGELAGLLASLAGQKKVSLEVILCDGGSSDGSQRIVSALSAECRFPVRLIRTECGRGRQMNAGAAMAASELLLFLHADSRFDESDALLKAVDLFRSLATGDRAEFAARFCLRFRRSTSDNSLPYFFYEAKARLPRRDCLRGDQGFLLSRRTFNGVGGFDESLPFLEDLRLVAALPPCLDWQLVPAGISTSARRFESEGLLQRQTLNAIIANNFQLGWNRFFEKLPGLYRNHCHTSGGKLLLYPILKDISRMLGQASAEWRSEFWRGTGRHVAANAWQLFFWLDVRSAFRRKGDPGEVRTGWLDFYHQRLERLFLSPFAALAARSAVRLWLRWMLFRGTRQTA